MGPSRTAAAGTMAGQATNVRTVLFSFLSRADATPLGRRSRAEGHVLGEDGGVLSDPAAEPSALVLEPDPNLAFEHWGDYWRKVHGVRFTHPEDGGDERTLAKLLRYDQIHRLAAGPSSLDALPYRPPLDAGGKLFDTVIGHVEPYRRPSWDGVAYLQFASLGDLQEVLGSERVRRKIIPEDRAIFRDLAPVLARRHVILSDDAPYEAVVLVKPHQRRLELDRSDFQRRWLEGHARVVTARPATRNLVRRYEQLHNVGPEESGAPFYHPATAAIDGVTIMAFGSMRDAEDFLLSPDHAAIDEAERDIARTGSEGFWTGVVFNVVG